MIISPSSVLQPWKTINEALEPAQRKQLSALFSEIKIIACELNSLRGCYSDNDPEARLIDRLRDATQNLPNLHG